VARFSVLAAVVSQSGPIVVRKQQRTGGEIGVEQANDHMTETWHLPCPSVIRLAQKMATPAGRSISSWTTPGIHARSAMSAEPEKFTLVCWVCVKPLSQELCKSDDRGRPIHEKHAHVLIPTSHLRR
jgi:hypothetical protein